MFVWDNSKDATNIAKHGIGFELAYEFDPTEVIHVDVTRDEDGENRMAMVGYIYGKLHTMIYTKRDECIRVISLSRSNSREEKIYEKTI